jgi:peptide/nickel transport system permease protein
MFGVFTVLYALAFIMPGDPIRTVLGEQYNRVDEETLEGLREELGLNDGFVESYLKFLGRTLRLDFGKSYILDQDVTDIIAYRLPRTLQLMTGGLLVALAIGIPAGILAAEKQYSWIDHTLMLVALVGVSMPIFWQALLMQLAFTQDQFGIALFPVAGYEGGSIRHMILPSLILGTNLSATIARVTRSAMLEVRGQDYIITARAKGLPYRSVLFRHQLRNALIPLITVVALNVAYLLGGSVVTETIFNWPGLGRALVPAIQRRDTPVIMGILLFGALMFMLINLITDLVYAMVNPRIRYE